RRHVQFRQIYTHKLQICKMGTQIRCKIRRLVYLMKRNEPPGGMPRTRLAGKIQIGDSNGAVSARSMKAVTRMLSVLYPAPLTIPDAGIRRSTAVMDRVHPLPAGGRDWKIAQPAISVNTRFSKILVTLGDPRGNFRSRRARAARRARYGELRSRPELRNRARGAA